MRGISIELVLAIGRYQNLQYHNRHRELEMALNIFNWHMDGTHGVVQSSIYCLTVFHMFLEKRGKRALGISILIIRSHHLPKKLLPAAVKESRTSLCSSSSIEQLQLYSSETYTLWSCAISPPCLHPTTQLTNNGDCG